MQVTTSFPKEIVQPCAGCDLGSESSRAVASFHPYLEAPCVVSSGDFSNIFVAKFTVCTISYPTWKIACSAADRGHDERDTLNFRTAHARFLPLGLPV